MTAGNLRRPGTGSCALAAVLFGASTPAASVIAQDTPALVLAGLLYLGAATAVLPWWVARRPEPGALHRARRPLAIAVIAGGAVGPALLTAGLRTTPASTASLLLNLELVMTLALAATLFREHLGPRMVTAAALVTGAGALLVWQPGASADLHGLLIVGACACWGLDNSVTARIDQVSPQHITFLKGTVAGSVNLVLGMAVGGRAGLDVTTVLAALAVGAIGYGASITLWVRGAQQLGAARGQLIFASAPFVGALISWVVLGDEVAAVQMLALALAACGVALSLRSDHEHVHRHQPMHHTHTHDHGDGHHHEHEHAEVGAEAGPEVGIRHAHPHDHVAGTHAHPHVPDLHHRHTHLRRPH
ncbi:MAG: DMT family transporter [Ilumatobacteraceae bacterium]